MSLSVAGIGCSSNPQAAQNRDHGYTGDLAFGESDTTIQRQSANEPQAASYQQKAASPSQPDRGDTGNGAFGETPP